MASLGHPNQLSAQVRDDGVKTLQTLLPEDDGDHREAEALMRAHRDVVASKDPDFQVYALVGAQQQELDSLGRVKATAAALTAVKKEVKKK